MNVHETARQYAAEAEQQAQAQVTEMDIETLRREYVALSSMVAYYTKIEREMTKPRLHLESIRKLLVKMKANEILHQAELAEEQGLPVSVMARVPAKPLLQLLDVLTTMTTSADDR